MDDCVLKININGIEKHCDSKILTTVESMIGVMIRKVIINVIYTQSIDLIVNLVYIIQQRYDVSVRVVIPMSYAKEIALLSSFNGIDIAFSFKAWTDIHNNIQYISDRATIIHDISYFGFDTPRDIITNIKCINHIKPVKYTYRLNLWSDINKYCSYISSNIFTDSPIIKKIFVNTFITQVKRSYSCNYELDVCGSDISDLRAPLKQPLPDNVLRVFDDIRRSQIDRVYYMLGGACNFHCRHCVQHDHVLRSGKCVNPDVISYLKKFNNTRTQIQFFGGEPLLYFDTIKYIVETLGDHYKYGITSNGSLLNSEMVDFINDHNIHFCVSNDGIDTGKVRDVNILEDCNFVRLFNKITHRSVDGVYHAYNTNVESFYNYVISKCGNIPVFIEKFICGANTPSDIVNFDIQEVKSQLYSARKKRIPISFVLENSKHTPSGPRATIRWGCAAGTSNISINNNGDIFMCKNYNESKIGTIYDNFNTLDINTQSMLSDLASRNLESKGCNCCDVYANCHGNCPFEPASVQQRMNCNVLRVKYTKL